MTTTVDLVALAASGQTKVTLLGGTITSLGSTGTDYAGFDDADSVYVEVQVQLRDNSRGAASLTLILQGSDDGNSWSTLETFTFSNNGTQTASVSTPNAHLRVTWTVARNTEWFIDHVTVAPALLNAPGGGGGGSQTLAEVLDTGNDAEGGTIKHVAVLEIAGGDSLTVANNSTDPDSDFNPLEINSSLIRVNLNGIESTSFDIKSANGRKTLLAGFNDTDEMVVGHSSGTLGFFSKAGVARPEVPASPSVQDVVDALVALGLVTQAA